jgi:MFS transporter, UMF1 family
VSSLDRPELRAWAMYDWANSAFWTTVIAAVFPNYFSEVIASGLPPGEATRRFALATAAAVGLVALLAPVLGALADYSAAKKRLLGSFMLLGAVATGCMALLAEGHVMPALLLFGLGNVGAAGSQVFYDSLLPHIAAPDEVDMVSSAGYALGYLGGGLLLAVNLSWITAPEWFGLPSAQAAVRLSFLSVALWWVGFSIPLFRRVPEPARRLEQDEATGYNPIGVAFGRLGETFRELRLYRQAFLMLVAFAIYNDGINTIIRMATIYGTEIGIDRSSLIAAILLVQFVGIPFSLFFGRLAGRITARGAIFVALGVYVAISLLAYQMTTAAHFFALAFMVATVQGGSQALSRSLFATLVPRHKSAEFFAFFGIFEKFAGIVGPLVFACAQLLSGQRPRQRNGDVVDVHTHDLAVESQRLDALLPALVGPRQQQERQRIGRAHPAELLHRSVVVTGVERDVPGKKPVEPDGSVVRLFQKRLQRRDLLLCLVVSATARVDRPQRVLPSHLHEPAVLGRETGVTASRFVRRLIPGERGLHVAGLQIDLPELGRTLGRRFEIPARGPLIEKLL